MSRIRRSSAAVVSTSGRQLTGAGSKVLTGFSPISIAILIANMLVGSAHADDLQSLIDSTCIACHDENTETRLDFTKLDRKFENDDTFRMWVKVFDRVQSNEMPPPTEARPNPKTQATALTFLQTKLTDINRSQQQQQGRVPSRRLTRQEYEYTLHDLLGIGGDLARHLPPENASGAFDVVAATQEISSVHVKSLLKVADLAVDEAIQTGPAPSKKPHEIDYFNSRYIQMWVDREVRRGGGTIFKTDHDVVTFRGENFVFRSDANGFRPPVAGQYKVTIKAAAYQPRSSISVSLKLQNDQQGKSELLGAWDLVDSDFRDVSTTAYLRPDDYIYVSADELDPAPDGGVIYNAQPAATFEGEGVRIRNVTVEGPLENSWPPERTRKLFPGVEWEDSRGILALVGLPKKFGPVLTKPPEEHLRQMVSHVASHAFRRNVSESEIDAIVDMSRGENDGDLNFLDSSRRALRAILISPELLFLTGPPGPLDDVSLASRLSYFLWRSLPDDELMQLAEAGRLSNPKTLADQVDRLLDHAKGERFINDFLDQWLDLDQIDATTPDAYLYPEYDDVLRRAMLAETRHFFRHLVAEDLSVRHLVKSDFTFLNRKLAEHYQIAGVEGEDMRKVMLPADSVRGGILGHASIAKITANGTVTTPVKRGNFVLTNLLGLPPDPPPPGVGSIEPDTRGATTIRETLRKHQSVTECAACHSKIDPPGFALECFDPVGTFRKRYRNSTGFRPEIPSGLRLARNNYRLGRPVDAAGMTEDGHAFQGIREYRSQLAESTEQVARNVVSLLIAFSTGAEVQFADRVEVERILDQTRSGRFRLRSLIHHVVNSRLFRNR